MEVGVERPNKQEAGGTGGEVYVEVPSLRLLSTHKRTRRLQTLEPGRWAGPYSRLCDKPWCV